MYETFLGVLGFLLLTAFPLGIAFLLFRRTPLGSGDIVSSVRNFTILLAVLGGPGALIAVGLFFDIGSLQVIGFLLYAIPLLIIGIIDKIGQVSMIMKFVDLFLPGGRDDNYSE
jgi:hypothetical protein